MKLDDKGLPDLASAVTPAEFGLLSRRIAERCDALDGLADGFVADTAACQREFQLGRDVPTCQGERTGQCLTAAQKQVVADVMRGPRKLALGVSGGRRTPLPAAAQQPQIQFAGWATPNNCRSIACASIDCTDFPEV